MLCLSSHISTDTSYFSSGHCEYTAVDGVQTSTAIDSFGLDSQVELLTHGNSISSYLRNNQPIFFVGLLLL